MRRERPNREAKAVHLLEPWGWIWMLVWIAALVFAVWLLVRSPAQRGAADDALSILRARYARGEISHEEFERARDVLLADRQEFTR